MLLLILLRFLCVLHMPPLPLSPHTTRRRMNGGGRQLIGCGGLGVIKNGGSEESANNLNVS